MTVAEQVSSSLVLLEGLHLVYCSSPALSVA